MRKVSCTGLPELRGLAQYFDRATEKPELGTRFGPTLCKFCSKGLQFAPLRIVGLDCLKDQTECLGDCPDAAYFGPNIEEDSDKIEMLSLDTADELHVVTLVNHRLLNAASYGSIAVLKSASPGAGTLSKTHMKVSHGR